MAVSVAENKFSAHHLRVWASAASARCHGSHKGIPFPTCFPPNYQVRNVHSPCFVSLFIPRRDRWSFGEMSAHSLFSDAAVASSKMPAKKTNKWMRYGLPLAFVAIAGLVLGVVLGTRASKSSKVAAASASSAAATSALGNKNLMGIFPTGTDSLYMLPLYPATVWIQSSSLVVRSC